jgi:hypothetical protein
MGCILPLLESYVPRVTEQIQSRLHGVFGGILRNYLPQHWILEVEGECYTIAVDALGQCRVLRGRSESPDVTITVGHDRLRAGLEHRDREAPVAGAYSVTYQSPKGETAYRFLRSRFGL